MRIVALDRPRCTKRYDFMFFPKSSSYDEYSRGRSKVTILISYDSDEFELVILKEPAEN